MEPIKLKRSLILPLLRSITKMGARPITVEMESFKKLPAEVDGESNPFGTSVLRHAFLNGIINFDYGKAVVKQRHKEGKSTKFKVGKSWATNIEKGVTQSDSGTKYVKMMVSSRKDTFWDDKGQAIPLESIKKFTTNPKSTKQNLDKQVEVRMIGVDNILSIKCENQFFQIV